MSVAAGFYCGLMIGIGICMTVWVAFALGKISGREIRPPKTYREVVGYRPLTEGKMRGMVKPPRSE